MRVIRECECGVEFERLEMAVLFDSNPTRERTVNRLCDDCQPEGGCKHLVIKPQLLGRDLECGDCGRRWVHDINRGGWVTP